MDRGHGNNHKHIFLLKNEYIPLAMKIYRKQCCVTSVCFPKTQFSTAYPTILLNYSGRHGTYSYHWLRIAITDYITVSINSFISLNLNFSISSGSSQIVWCWKSGFDNNKSHPNSVNPMAGRRHGFLEISHCFTTVDYSS